MAKTPHDELADFTQVQVRAVIAEPNSQAPVILLQPPGEDILVPIWVGPFEGQAIAMAAKGIEGPRPLTHDLLLSVIQSAGLTVDCVRIHTLEDNIFFASIILLCRSGPDKVQTIDCRPSDGIALALRAGARILVADSVLAAAKVEERTTEEALRLILEKLQPEDLGKYEM